jgi:hypothetical protein
MARHESHPDALAGRLPPHHAGRGRVDMQSSLQDEQDAFAPRRRAKGGDDSGKRIV